MGAVSASIWQGVMVWYPSLMIILMCFDYIGYQTLCEEDGMEQD
jgi:hypothetical protein